MNGKDGTYWAGFIGGVIAAAILLSMLRIGGIVRLIGIIGGGFGGAYLARQTATASLKGFHCPNPRCGWAGRRLGRTTCPRCGYALLEDRDA